MALFPEIHADAVFLSRTNEEDVLASFYLQSFELDGEVWPSIEHYFQAMKFDGDAAYQHKISKALTAKKARQLGRSRLKRIRKDWKDVRKTMMTRAVYICARTHASLYDALLDSADVPFIENNNYDYYWGCGRDRRGENQYGKVLMAVRAKLLAEKKAEKKAEYV